MQKSQVANSVNVLVPLLLCLGFGTALWVTWLYARPMGHYGITGTTTWRSMPAQLYMEPEKLSGGDHRVTQRPVHVNQSDRCNSSSPNVPVNTPPILSVAPTSKPSQDTAKPSQDTAKPPQDTAKQYKHPICDYLASGVWCAALSARLAVSPIAV